MPSNGVVRNSRGDAAYTSLLSLGYSHHKNADIEIELMDARQYSGNDILARINGSGHKVKIVKPDGNKLTAPLRIVCGESYRGDEQDIGWTSARQIRLVNDTAQPVLLTELSSGCLVASKGPVRDQGMDNRELPASNATLPP